MNDTPLLSIIIPCYNHEHYVQDCIQSIINQDYKNIELIIIDDGSKDNSVEKIKAMSVLCNNRFVRFEFRHRPNKGLCATLNEGLAWCQGKYMSIIASDDIMLPHKSSVQINYLENNPDITSVSANVQYIDSDGNIIKNSTQQYREISFEENFLKNELYAPTQMHKLTAIQKIGGYDENIKIEDWLMWLKLLNSGHRVVFLPDILAQYRQHAGSMSYDKYGLIQSEKQIYQLFKNHPLYQKANYILNKKEIKIYRDNGRKIKYYYLKFILAIKYYLT